MVRLNENPPVFQESDVELDDVAVTDSEASESAIADGAIADGAIADNIEWPPRNLYSDEPPLETDFHRSQIDLLIRLLHYWWRERQDFYISGNLTVYYNTEQLKKRDFVGPDVFVVMGAEKRERRSWAIWEEDGKYPDLVIELLSNSTAKVDKGAKKALYQDVWQLPEYYWFHPETLEFAGFRLTHGQYEPITPTETGLLWSERLGLHLGIHERQLRWFTAEGTVIPLPEEAERDRAEQAQKRVEQLEAFMRTQGINPDQLPET
jgi:Uma2 family endonuclease